MSLILSPLDHEHFLRYGYVVVKNVVMPETIQQALNVVETGPDTPESPGFEKVQACITAKVYQVIEEILGSEYPLDQHCVVGNRPKVFQPHLDWEDPTTDLHTDNCVPTLMPSGWVVGVFIFLTTVQSRGGALIAFPESANRFRLALARTANVLNDAKLRSSICGQPIEILVSAGDILLYQHLFGHAGSLNVSSPTTRHMLGGRFSTTKRILPGNKAFMDMSTLEKANSLRFLREHFQIDYPIPQLRKGTQSNLSLKSGYRTPHGVKAAAALRDKGLTHLFYVDAIHPHTIEHVSTPDWVSWRSEGRLQLSSDSVIRSISFFRRSLEVVLLVNIGEECLYTHVFRSMNWQEWSLIGTLSGLSCTSAYYAHPGCGLQGKRSAMLFFTTPNEPNVLWSRYGDDWLTVNKWNDESRITTFPNALKVEDILVDRVSGDLLFSRIVDLGLFGSSQNTQPYYALARGIEDLTCDLQAIKFSGQSPPRHIRIYDQTQNYWLVTYLRGNSGQASVHWGFIDWAQQPLVLRNIDSVELLEEALCTVGLR